jgi:NADPH2:quinone reductase
VRAAILTAYGEPPQVGDFDEPAPTADGQEVAQVLAAGMNPVDISTASGTFYGGSPPLPSVVGREAVVRTAAGRTAYIDHSIAPFGSFAERTLIEPGTSYAVPEDLDPALAVCFGIAGLAGWLAVGWRGGLQQGETVIVLGAGGVVGQVAIQAARLLGAARIVAVAREADRLEHATVLGADATVRIGDHDDLTAALKDASGGGADVVVDPIWGEPAKAALGACNPYGRVVNLGQSAGAEATLASAAIRGRPLSILGHTNFAVSHDVKREAYERMCAHALAGELRVEVDRIPLERATDAWTRQGSSPGVKLVVVP